MKRPHWPKNRELVRLAVLVVMASGCAHSADRIYSPNEYPDCRRPAEELEAAAASARETIETWLEFAEVDAERSSAEASSPLAVRSYPNSDAPLGRRSYLYDNALALLWYAWKDEREVAERLAATLIDRQREDGGWRYQFDLEEAGPSSALVRNGAVAWAGYALAHFARRHDREPSRRAAVRAAEYLWRTRLSGAAAGGAEGLVSAGYTLEADGPRREDFAATEHQFDAQVLFERVAPEHASRLQRRILGQLWIDDEGRFAMGARSEGLDRRRALDAAGAWGALWLHSVGREDLARRSLAFAIEEFRATESELRGYRPYLDATDRYDPEESKGLVFVEGTLAVGLASLRLGRRREAERTLRTAAQLQCMTGAGLPYSNLETRDFAAEPAAAPSLWFLFLEREWRTGRRAPLFRPFRPSSSESESENERR